mmetsp:Transcript_1391/g.2527  ORF Transcript_1391/g.2527 Transcript_1391/m.2527 type:complete len:106 (+) Transcript_1391:304-621(+)
MLTTLCRHLATKCHLGVVQSTASSSIVVSSPAAMVHSAAHQLPVQQRRCLLSSMASANNQGHKEDEFVTVLKLNMLQDNPGAVKKVRRLIKSLCVCVCRVLHVSM